jgi:hypothetical protein
MDESHMLPATPTNTQNDPPSRLSLSSTSTTSSVAASPTRRPNAFRYSTTRRIVSKSSCSKDVPQTYADSVGRQSSFGSNSITEVDADFNEAMAETWSAPTHAGSDYDALDQCFTSPFIASSLHASDNPHETTVPPYSSLANRAQSDPGGVTRRRIFSNFPFSPRNPGTVEMRRGTLSSLPHSESQCDETISSTDSHTLVNPVLNEVAWSETTVQEYTPVVDELDYCGTSPSGYDAADYTVPWSKSQLQELGICSSLERYQAEDPGEESMTVFSLRVSESESYAMVVD